MNQKSCHVIRMKFQLKLFVKLKIAFITVFQLLA